MVISVFLRHSPLTTTQTFLSNCFENVSAACQCDCVTLNYFHLNKSALITIKKQLTFFKMVDSLWDYTIRFKQQHKLIRLVL